MGVRNGEL